MKNEDDSAQGNSKSVGKEERLSFALLRSESISKRTLNIYFYYLQRIVRHASTISLTLDTQPRHNQTSQSLISTNLPLHCIAMFICLFEPFSPLFHLLIAPLFIHFFRKLIFYILSFYSNNNLQRKKLIFF